VTLLRAYPYLQALDLSLSENASLRSAANKGKKESHAVEEARAELLRQKTESVFKVKFPT
jgi:outer membrane protein TolC